jgi:OOP family OmpA-OmpF porin
METGLVTAESIGEGLKAEGRVVLDGILFDTDKATIKVESKPALDAIATFLRDHAALKAYIVGHTDGTGEFEHNMQLAKDRAAAVAAALVNDYQIAPERLAAHGVGSLSPARTNKTDAGAGAKPPCRAGGAIAGRRPRRCTNSLRSPDRLTRTLARCLSR